MRNQSGSILLPILAVLFIISLILTSVMIYGAWHKLQAQKAFLKLKSSYLAEAGVNKALWLLSGNDGKDIWWRTDNYQDTVHDFGRYQFSIKNWGGYIAVESEGKVGAIMKKVRTLIGQKPDKYFSRAINLGDPGYPLVVTGNNRIVGDVLVGPAGVMEGKFKGEGFIGTTYVDGNIITQSNFTLPYFSEDILTEFRENIEKERKRADKMDKSLTLDDYTQSDFLKDKSLWIDGNILIRSNKPKEFLGPAFIYCSGRIEIAGMVSLGKGLILIAEKSIAIVGQTQIRDCILYSRGAITLKDQTLVQGQVISEERLEVLDQSKVSYPSVLYVKGKKDKNKIEGEMIVATKAHSEGILVYYDDSYLGKDNNFISKNDGKISLGKNSVFSGTIYSTNYTQLEGSVIGNVSTKMFYLYFEPTTYINWLKDSFIDRTRLNKEMVLPLTFGNPHKLEIAQYQELN